MQKFPVEELRHDQVEILIIGKKKHICLKKIGTNYVFYYPFSPFFPIIEPYNACPNQDQSLFCGQENELSLGPTFQYLRQLKELRIKHSRIPNIGRKTLWGLSGLEILDLSHNALSTVIEPNFDTLYSLRELYLNDNTIKSIVSAAFRHATKLQILSLANNMLEGEYLLLLLMQLRPHIYSFSDGSVTF